MITQAIIPAAGLGERLKNKIPKPLVLLKGKPLLIYCLETLDTCSLIDSVILIVHPEWLEEYSKIIRQYKMIKVVKILPGGSERSQSVLEGLKALDSNTQMVLIHDGVRPFAPINVIENALLTCEQHGAVVAGVPVKSTIKRLELETQSVLETIDRQSLWEIQTPQVFWKDIIWQAYEKAQGFSATDDASLVERMGRKVKVIFGDYMNIKITTQEDILLAEAFLENHHKI